MKLEVNIDKKVGIGIIVSVLIFAGVLLVIAYDGPIPNPGHGGDRVLVDVDGDPLNGAGEMTLQDAFDSGYATGAWLCFNDDAKDPCIQAKANEGTGQNGYRVVNCQHPNPPNNLVIIGRTLKFNTNTNIWQYYTTEDNWRACLDGSVLVVKAVGPF